MGAAGALSLPSEPVAVSQATDADLIVLYGTAGLAALRELRARRSGARVLLLADADGRPSRAEALEAGADDWTAGTLDPATAVPRLRALSTLEEAGPRTLRLPGCVVDLVSRRVRRADGGEARLTEQEARLLERLAATPGVPVHRDTLLTEVWGYHPNVVSRAPDVAIRRLRTKIEMDPADPRLVVTSPTGGWALQADARLRHGVAAPRVADPDLIGRDDEIAAVDAAWSDGARLVALSGPPGIGKTAVAERAVRGLPWPVIRVALDGAATRADVVHAFARAAEAVLGDAEDLDDAEARVARILDVRGALVWVDGCDGAVGPLTALVARWLREAPGARFLVCTRERLRMDEREIRLDSLRPADAARLFVQRARAAGFTEAIDEQRLDRLVRALDGLPLAVELAAARVRTLGLDGLLHEGGARLDRLRERTREGRGVRSLDDAIASSWDALDADARAVLASLSQLPAGFDLPTAEAVAPPASAWVGDVLDELEDRSLLRVVSSPHGPRFVVPEVIRWFAARRLDDPGARERLVAWARARRRVEEGDPVNLKAALEAASALGPVPFAELALHVDELLEAFTSLDEREALLTRAASPGLPPPLARRLRLRAHDVAWCRGRDPGPEAWRALQAEAEADGDTWVAERAAVDLARCLRSLHGPGIEPLVDLDALVERSDDPEVRIQALRERARQHAEAGRWPEARIQLDRALTIDRRAGTGQRPRLLLEAARVALDAFRPGDGHPLVREVLEAPEVARDPCLQEAAWSMLGGLLLLEGRSDEATTAYERALALEERLGLLRPAAVTLGNLGILYAELGDTAESRRALERAIAAHLELGQARSEATCRVNLGQTALLEGHVDEARALIEGGLRAADEAGWRVLSAAARYGLGVTEALAGRDDEAVVLWEEAVRRSEPLDHFWIAALASAQLSALAAARGETATAEAWADRARRHAAVVASPGVSAAVAVLTGDAPEPVESEPVEARLARAVLARRAA